jgi:hypothetical protein
MLLLAYNPEQQPQRSSRTMKHMKLHEKQGHLGFLGGSRKRSTFNVR